MVEGFLVEFLEEYGEAYEILRYLQCLCGDTCMALGLPRHAIAHFSRAQTAHMSLSQSAHLDTQVEYVSAMLAQKYRPSAIVDAAADGMPQAAAAGMSFVKGVDIAGWMLYVRVLAEMSDAESAESDGSTRRAPATRRPRGVDSTPEDLEQLHTFWSALPLERRLALCRVPLADLVTAVMTLVSTSAASRDGDNGNILLPQVLATMVEAEDQDTGEVGGFELFESLCIRSNAASELSDGKLFLCTRHFVRPSVTFNADLPYS